MHAVQEERFQILRARVGFKVGGKKTIAGAGQRLTVAARTESLIETMFALAADGRTNRKGMPNPLRLAVIAQAHFDTVRLPFPPAVIQWLELAVGSPERDHGRCVPLHGRLPRELVTA